ncbi:trace amine-associated receptor 4-like [Notolabrus celidotus]|uniref:trace amine-associated receptor 4-like n=1 Tax=Notolabrus celidotus TaxID=1203425 RepID=UPI00148FD52F|nr:trace amine-associated receptor 4-like [Notolabrus celidotus]
MISTPRTNTSDNHSLTEDGIDSASFHSTISRVCVLCLLLPIPIFAIIGNVFIMAAFALFQCLRTPTNAFIVSLAVADFLVAVLVMPFSLVRSVDRWHFGLCFCQAHLFLDMTFCTTSIFNLTCVALDRYIAVCDPLHYPVRMSFRRVGAMLLLCWVLPLVFSALCVSLGMYTQSARTVVTNSTLLETQTCLATFQLPYAFATSAISFFIPLGFMLFAYGKILKAAQRQARWIHAIDHHTGQLQMNQTSMRTDPSRQVQAHVERCSLKKKEWRAVKTLGLIMGVILFCWLPFFCVNIIHPLKGYSLSPLLLEASMWLGYANSSLNPFLYGLFNKNYGHVFAAMFDWGTLGRQLRAGLDSSTFGRQAHTVVTLETISG